MKEITKRFKWDIMSLSIGLFHLSAGVHLYKAESGVQDFEVVAQHFNFAIRMGWIQGHYYLGMLYKSGFGVERCDITARNFFEQGTDTGVAAAVSELRRCYDEGIGVERDSSKAVEFVKRSVQRSDPLGYVLRAYYNLHGHNNPVNPSCGLKMAKRLPRVTVNRTILQNAVCTESVSIEIGQKPSG